MTPQENIVCRYSYDINPLSRIVADRVIILGDAAHAKNSSTQGMSSGFQDAILFANYLTASATVDEALAGFEKERLPLQTSREISQKTGQVNKVETA